MVSNIEVPTRKAFFDSESSESSITIEPLDPAKDLPRKTGPAISIHHVNKELSMIREENKDYYEDSDDDNIISASTPTIKIQSVESIQSLIGEETNKTIADNSPDTATLKSPTS